MKWRNKNSRPPASAWVAVLVVAVSCLLVVGEGKAAPPLPRTPKKKAKSTKEATSRKPAAKKATAKAAPRTSSKKSKARVRRVSRRRRLPRSSRGRLALLHLDPHRVEEIQTALIREGVLSGDPSGTWDSSTKAAMKEYQSQNGFSETGLPDAKSLMKLGLGPHPLPPDIPAASSQDGQAKIDALEHPNN